MLFTPDQLAYEGAKILPLEELMVCLSEKFSEKVKSYNRIYKDISIRLDKAKDPVLCDSILFHERALINKFESLGWYNVSIYGGYTLDIDLYFIEVILEK